MADFSDWVLFDGDCGICRGQAPFWAPILARRGFEMLPLQDPRVQERLGEVDGLLDDFRIVTADGAQYVGADAYRFAMRRIWWAWPLYALAVIPGIRRLFDAGYRFIARRRHRISRALPGSARR